MGVRVKEGKRSPLYGRFSVLLKIGVGLRKMMTAEKSAIGAQRRRVYGSEYQMSGAVDESRLLLCITSPQEENQSVAFGSKSLNHGIGEDFPTVTLVRTCLMCPDRKGGVEQEYALCRPTTQTAALRNGNAEVVVNLFEDVLQRRGMCHTVGNRKAKSFGLSEIMIGVLSENDDFYLVERAEIKRIEDERTGWKAFAVAIFLPDKLSERLKIRFVKLFLQYCLPTGRYLDLHFGDWVAMKIYSGH